jgi:glycine/serine hydroxymethyltransferase
MMVELSDGGFDQPLADVDPEIAKVLVKELERQQATLNLSGRLYEVVSYGVNRDGGLVDMDQVAALARETRPKLIVAGWSAYPRQLDFAASARSRTRSARC